MPPGVGVGRFGCGVAQLTRKMDSRVGMLRSSAATSVNFTAEILRLLSERPGFGLKWLRIEWLRNY